MSSSQIRISRENNEVLCELCAKLGVSRREIVEEALFYFFTKYHEDLQHRISLKFLERRGTKLARQRFFVKNVLVKLFRHVEWRIKFHGIIDKQKDCQIYVNIVKEELAKLPFLDENVQKEIEEDVKAIKRLVSKRAMLEHINVTMHNQKMLEETK